MYNKNNLEVYKIVSKERCEGVLSGVLFTGEATVATDTHLLIEVSTPNNQDIEDYPTSKEYIINEHKPFVIKADVVKNLIKDIPKNSSLPILENIVVAKSDDEEVASLVTADFTTVNVHKVKKLTGNYPDYKQLFTKEDPKTTIRLSPELLKKIAEFYCKTLEAKSYIDVLIYDEDKPVEFRGENTVTEQEIRALLMPMKRDVS